MYYAEFHSLVCYKMGFLHIGFLINWISSPVSYKQVSYKRNVCIVEL